MNSLNTITTLYAIPYGLGAAVRYARAIRALVHINTCTLHSYVPVFMDFSFQHKGFE